MNTARYIGLPITPCHRLQCHVAILWRGSLSSETRSVRLHFVFLGEGCQQSCCFVVFSASFKTCLVFLVHYTQLFQRDSMFIRLTGLQDNNTSTSYKSATIALAVLFSIILVGVIAVGAFVLYRRAGISE